MTKKKATKKATTKQEKTEPKSPTAKLVEDFTEQLRAINKLASDSILINERLVERLEENNKALEIAYTDQDRLERAIEKLIQRIDDLEYRMQRGRIAC